MYYRKIGSELVPTYHAINSAGAFVAATKKVEDKVDGWTVVRGSSRSETELAKGLTLEQALDFIEVNA